MLIKISHDNDYVDVVPFGCYRDPMVKLSERQLAYSDESFINHENIRAKVEPSNLIEFMKAIENELKTPVSFHVSLSLLANSDYDAVILIDNDTW